MRLRKRDIYFALNLNIQIRNLTDISGSILPVSYFWEDCFKNDDFVGNTQNKNDDFEKRIKMCCIYSSLGKLSKRTVFICL